MKASPKRWALWADSFRRRVHPGEWGIVVKSEVCGCPHNCVDHSRFWVEFGDKEIVIALFGYWEFKENG